ncbi:MAG TPA: VOC family protein [Vicinamibacterales bacterium]|nr:VOC family protein [Vicinamibacterales bacterium]
MAKALGMGGVFFTSPDPRALLAWYQRHLGFAASPEAGVAFLPAAMPANAYTVWSAFPASTRYFDPSSRGFMINLVVDDLDAALAQVRNGGAIIVGAVESFDNGRFGWFVDPDGNKVELWEPR